MFVGLVTGANLLPEGALRYLRPGGASSYWHFFPGLAAVACIVFGLGILENSIDRQQRLDRYLLEAFLEHIPDNVFFKDLDSRFVRISDAMARYCGLRNSAQAIQKTDADIFTGEHAAQALADEREVIRTGRSIIDREEKETWPDGRETWVLTTKVPLRDKRGRITGTMGITRDVTARKQAELRIRHAALHDSLTGLPNRMLLEDRLNQATASARRERKSVAIMVLDMDRFNYVNDSLGYFVGDRLLEAVAVRLKDCLRESDSVARGGGDEFVIVVPGVSEREEIDLVAKKVLGVIAEPFQVECHEVRITGSMGISQFPKDGEIPEKLLQEADAAMFNSKKRGRGCYTFCSPAMTEASRRQQRLEADLVQACSRDEFVLHYQPFVESESGRITGMEALLRWKHPGHGLISPNQFIPYLEEMGMMVEVGRWAMRSACRQSVEWQRQGLPAIRIAVNVSSQQFYQGNIVDMTEFVLRETGLDPKLLELELTESRVLDSSEGTLSIMRRLKQIGVSLSLDDFGTGWSSLSYLRSFPLDRIKIDRSFVRDIATEPTARAMVKSILGLGQSLSVACIAEGVETPQQRDFLKNQKCPEMQGFYFSRPLAAVDSTALLREATLDAKGVSGKWGARADGASAPFSRASGRQPALQLRDQVIPKTRTL